eukprot:TRINITY_DN3076_c0_g1_i2.p1 TRINITY_DN3076_c0_g1~~TRINITY_DN3076_c0_g1_i2.p1  ORF type:complete len:375 (+),score=64.26 TRINITY_DN3076_c0_g1_i2:45-1169(+)
MSLALASYLRRSMQPVLFSASHGNITRSNRCIFLRDLLRRHSSISERPLVYVGMSGGVDSSVAALLLHQQGYRVEGVYMKNWDSSDEIGEQACPIDQDLMDVSAVCNKIGIRFHMVDFVKDYWNEVFEGLLKDYSNGITPNPDVFCNSQIKFKRFLEYSMSRGADLIATGHYAQIVKQDTGDVFLSMSPDKTKDQSYFLSRVSQDAFKKTLFPIGHLHKHQVKQIAEQYGLHNHSRKESMGICFVGKKKSFLDFLSNYIPDTRKGVFKSIEDGKILGTHQGAVGYTFGQKAKIPGMPSKMYVVDKDLESGTVYVANCREHPALYCDELEAESVHWISGKAPISLLKVQHTNRYILGLTLNCDDSNYFFSSFRSA